MSIVFDFEDIARRMNKQPEMVTNLMNNVAYPSEIHKEFWRQLAIRRFEKDVPISGITYQAVGLHGILQQASSLAGLGPQSGNLADFYSYNHKIEGPV